MTTNRSQLLMVFAVAVMTAVSIGPVLAEGGPVATVCADDKVKFCADVPHGGGQVRACLDANVDKVSEQCRTALGAHGPSAGQAKKEGVAPK